MDSMITLVGNLSRDPEIRFTAGGQAVLGFGIAVNRRWQDKQTQEWQEEVSFVDCTAWGQLASNISESCEKGTRVIVTGRIQQENWETKEGEKRSKLKVVCDSVGCDMRFATVEVTRNERSDRSTGGQAQDAAAGAGFSEDDV